MPTKKSKILNIGSYNFCFFVGYIIYTKYLFNDHWKNPSLSFLSSKCSCFNINVNLILRNYQLPLFSVFIIIAAIIIIIIINTIIISYYNHHHHHHHHQQQYYHYSYHEKWSLKKALSKTQVSKYAKTWKEIIEKWFW